MYQVAEQILPTTDKTKEHCANGDIICDFSAEQLEDQPNDSPISITSNQCTMPIYLFEHHPTSISDMYCRFLLFSLLLEFESHYKT